jgi:hypothetical protein
VEAAGNSHGGFVRNGDSRTPACRAQNLFIIHFLVAVWRRKTAESRRVKYCGTLILAVLFASLALSEDFKTTKGKVCKDASMKPTAPLRNEFSMFATTPCHGLSLSR